LGQLAACPCASELYHLGTWAPGQLLCGFWLQTASLLAVHDVLALTASQVLKTRASGSYRCPSNMFCILVHAECRLKFAPHQMVHCLDCTIVSARERLFCIQLSFALNDHSIKMMQFFRFLLAAAGLRQALSSKCKYARWRAFLSTD